MTIRYKRLWLVAAVLAVALAGQNVTQGQAADEAAKEKQAGQQPAQADESAQIKQGVPERAGDQTKVQADRDKMEKKRAAMDAGEKPTQFHAASQLIGTELQNAQGEELGEVDEVVLDQNNNRVAYIVLSHGGFADIGDKLLAVPFNAIQWGQGDQRSVFPVDQERLQQAPGFDKNNWPDMADEQWSKEVETYWQKETRGEAGARPQAQAARAGGELRWVSLLSELIGRNVKNDQQRLGEVEDVYIDQQGRLGFAAISFGGMLGINDRIAVVPYNALTPRVGENDFQLTATEADLKATVIKDQLKPGLSDAKMARINRQYKAAPYWEASAQSEMRAQRDRMRDQIAMQRSQRETAQDVPDNTNWRAESDYNKQFKADHVKTYEGTIISVGQFEPGSDAAPGLRLRVRTQDNQTLTVHGGPVEFAQQKQMSFNPGDKITIQGAQAEVDKSPVILASQIKVEQQTLQLRDQAGKPQWTLDEGSVQQASPERSDRRTRVTADEEQLEKQKQQQQQQGREEAPEGAQTP